MRRWCLAGCRAIRWRENRKFLEPLPEGAELLNPPAFVEPPRLRAFAAVATWGGLALEALVALLCLIPAGRAHRSSPDTRRCSLFCATTYALAPVAGFGWLLATMGLAQCRPDQRSAARRLRRGVRADPAVLRDSRGPASWRTGRAADRFTNRAPGVLTRTRNCKRLWRGRCRAAHSIRRLHVEDDRAPGTRWAAW